MSDMRQGQGKVIRGGESKENQGQVLKKKITYFHQEVWQKQ